MAERTLSTSTNACLGATVHPLIERLLANHPKVLEAFDRERRAVRPTSVSMVATDARRRKLVTKNPVPT